MTGDEPDVRAKIQLIHNGQVVKQALLKLPYEGVWQHASLSRRGYYRLLVEIDAYNQLVSNPIFFNSEPSKNTEVVSTNTDSHPLPSSEAKKVVPETEPPAVAPVDQYVEVTGRGVRLRKGPSVQFPVVGKADQGERLLFVRRTEVVYNGKPWIVIKREGELAYLWEGLAKELPTDQRN